MVTRARSHYLKYGDANTRWFHSQASMRSKRNSIARLHDNNGDWRTNLEDITNVLNPFFGDLLTSSGALDMESVLDCISTRVTAEMNASLYAPYRREEFEKALK